MIKYIIFIVTIKILNWDSKINTYFARLGLAVALYSLFEVFREPNWFWKAVDFLYFIVGGLVILAAYLQMEEELRKKTDKKTKMPDLLLVMMELGILFFWAMNQLAAKVLIGFLAIFPFIADYFIEGLWQTKKLLKDDMTKYDTMENGHALLFIFLITFTIKTKIIDVIVDKLIPHGGWLEFIVAVVREALKWTLVALAFLILSKFISVIGTLINEILKKLVSKMVDSILKTVRDCISLKCLLDNHLHLFSL